MFLPRTLSTIADPRNALARLSLVFRVPLREGAPFVVDPEQEAAVWAKGRGDVGGESEGEEGDRWRGEGEAKRKRRGAPTRTQRATAFCAARHHPLHPAQHARRRRRARRERQVESPAGPHWEMCSTDTGMGGGKWVCGGSVAWIQNGTLMDTVLFGQPFEEDSAKIRLLADKDLTEKQRVNIVRAVLRRGRRHLRRSAFRCGHQRRQGALCSAIQGLVAQGKTVLLVHHGGGTYPGLITPGGEFARLDRESGGAKAEDAGREGVGEDEDEAQFGKDIDTIDNVLLCPDLTEDPAIVAKRTELAQRMKMLEGVRKDLMAFEK
ncbi:hypothetical protein B0H13DRAFT_1910289 [Mycena leptocephala]|nr:hypothetical protein B0H13DRAFT_1910289 [Mycena leptocephala]